MRDITSKQITLRTANAMGIIWCSENTLQLVKDKKLPKGNPFDFAKAAAFMGAKQTQLLIPHCHPVGIEGLEVEFELLHPGDYWKHLEGTSPRFGIMIEVFAKSIGRTGIEMEALTAASTAALTLYDLMKPLADSTLEISHIQLLEKKGGKSDRDRMAAHKMEASFALCSDDVAKGFKEDQTSKIVEGLLKKHNTKLLTAAVIENDKEAIKSFILEQVAIGTPFIFIAGGTGIRQKDNTYKTVKKLLDHQIPGIPEAMRGHGQLRTPLAMLSRTIAGVKGDSIIISIPGSSSGAQESLEAILPGVLKAHWMLKKIDRSEDD